MTFRFLLPAFPGSDIWLNDHFHGDKCGRYNPHLLCMGSVSGLADSQGVCDTPSGASLQTAMAHHSLFTVIVASRHRTRVFIWDVCRALQTAREYVTRPLEPPEVATISRAMQCLERSLRLQRHLERLHGLKDSSFDARMEVTNRWRLLTCIPHLNLQVSCLHCQQNFQGGGGE